MSYIDTQRIHIADLDTLEHVAIDLDATQRVPVTPIPAMPQEIAAGPAWILYKYDASDKYNTSYALVLHCINGRQVELPIETMLGMLVEREP